MKICPACRTTYDDGLNFCLEDGSVLTFAPEGGAPTVVMGQPRHTDPASASEVSATRNEQNIATRSVQPKKKSRTWMWVMAILAVLVLVCGGGLVGFFLYVASLAESNTSANKGTNNSTRVSKANTFTRATPSPVAETNEAQEVDLSGWVKEPTEWLETAFEDGEFFMTSKQKDYYYVLVSKDEAMSDGRAARVTVRNPDDGAVTMGFGLVFHSETTPLANDYAFLIDTKRKKYRVVRHESSQEKTITAWTSSDLIKAGSELNLLEARDRGDRIELYINGQLANTITNKQGPGNGVPGLYVGDGAKIGFRKLEVVK